MWWDVSLTPGVRFRDKIAQELQAARCVVVLWSKALLKSDFVIDEAEDGKLRGVLVQAVIEDVRPPHGFRQIQFASLVGWDGSDSGEFAQLCAGISLYALPSRSAESEEPFPNDLPIPEQWWELKRRFRNLQNLTLIANPNPVLGWLVVLRDRGLGAKQSKREFLRLAELAGGLLKQSSSVWAEFEGDIVTNDHLDRWISFLARRRSAEFEPVENLTKVSAEACAYCADKEANR